MRPLLGYIPQWLTATFTASESSSTGSGGGRRRDDNWVDGLRGIASFIVLTGHLNSCFAVYLHQPAIEENGPTLLLQYPILRLAIGGRGAIAIFFIITGYVNSLNAIKNFRAGNVGPSLLNMARGSFTRVGRLQLPSFIIVLISWMFSQLGFYKVGERIDCRFFRNTSTFPDNFRQSLVHLWENLVLSWHTSYAYYDPFQWTMTYILAASFRVYLVLLVLGFMRRRYSYIITLFLYWFAFITDDVFIGMNVMVGIFFAQLHTDLGPRALNLLPRPVPALTIILGLLIWSYPFRNPEWVWWSRMMQRMMQMTGIEDQDMISRHWVSVGVTIVMLGITFSRSAQWFLKLPLFNFLGRCSYAVYLIHHTAIRSVLIWMLYGQAWLSTPEKDPEGNPILLETPSNPYFLFVCIIFYLFLYAAAYSWTLYVDPFCARTVARVKNHIFRDDEKPQEKALPLTSVTAIQPQ